jgi:hypothetical protein
MRIAVLGDYTGDARDCADWGRLGADLDFVREHLAGLAFGMTVVAWSANLTDERAAEAGVTRAAKKELFACPDIVTLHLVLSGRSRGIVGREELRAMQPSACLVNSARAALIDPGALREAITGEWLAGVALDVYDTEPLPPGHWLSASTASPRPDLHPDGVGRRDERGAARAPPPRLPAAGRGHRLGRRPRGGVPGLRRGPLHHRGGPAGRRRRIRAQPRPVAVNIIIAGADSE